MKRVNITKGDRYGRLTVIEELETIVRTNGKKQRNFRLKCDCGKVKDVYMEYFRYGQTRSCGCLALEVLKKRAITHAMSSTPEYKSWRSIKDRCINPNSTCYGKYGAKGISVHTDWINDFMAFYNHIGPKPKDGLRYSVDRIDNAKGYEPNNVRWVTDTLQARNRTLSRNNKTGTCGVYWKTVKQSGGKDPTTYAVAHWTDLIGKLRKKSFSVKVYGEELALFLAEEYRDQQMLLLNLMGAGYSNSHGKEVVRLHPHR